MQIFRRKPLMFCCFCFIAASITSFFMIEKAKKISVFMIFVLTISILVALLCLKKRNIRIKLTVVFIALIMCLVAFAESYFYYNVYASSFNNYIGRPVKAEATVIDEITNETYYSDYIVKIRSVDDEEINGKAILHIEGESGASVGKTIEFYCECVTLKEYSFNENVMFSYISDGIIGVFEVNSDNSSNIKLKEIKSSSKISTFNNALTYDTELRLDGEVGKLFSAMLLGRRDRLSEKTQRDFSRSGISHMLALSGLHISILVGFFDILLKRLGVSKIFRCALLPFVMLGYLALTGFALSTVRAVVMMTAMFFSYIIGSPIDKLTVLFASCAAIIAILPSSVVDIGFWMSYLATFGLIVASPYISKIFKRKDAVKFSDYPKAALRKILKYICQSLLITITAVMSVILLTQIAFGELSLVSLGANLVCVPLMTAFLILSVLFVFLGRIPMVEKIILSALVYVGELLLKISAYFSDINDACISLEFEFAKIIVLIFVISMAVLLVIKLKRKIFMIFPAVVCSIAFIICFSTILIKGENEAELTYIKRGERETFVVVKGVDAAFIDVGDGNYSNYTVAWDIAHADGATEIKTLLLTHYHNKHGYSISRLLSNVKVRRVMIPYPETQEDMYILDRIFEVTSTHGVECRMYERGSPFAVLDGVGLKLLPYDMLKRSSQPTVAFEIEYGEFKSAYIGSSYYESDHGKYADDCVYDADVVIYGTHGPNPKSDFSIDPANNAKEIVFADRETASYSSFDIYMPRGKLICDCEIRRFKTENFTK